MTDQTSAPAVDSSPAPANDLTPHDLGNLFAEARQEKPEDAQSAESAEPATAESGLADEANAAPAEQAHGETQEADPAAEPPIERPRSWTEAEDAEWRATPRVLQQKIVARELERDNALRRTQNEAADKLKGLTAKEQEVEKAKSEYEAKLPALMQALQDVNVQQYSDIKSMADVNRIQNEIFRLTNEGDFIKAQQYQSYLSGWQVHQQNMAAVKADLDRVEGEKSRKHQSEWAEFVQTQNALAVEHIPELADPAKAAALTNRAGDRLKELGFKQDELDGFLRGEKISPFDYRFQRLLVNDLKLSDIQKAKVTALAKPAPAVQRPGTAKPQGTAQSETYTKLSAQLERSGDPKDLGALIGHLRRA